MSAIALVIAGPGLADVPAGALEQPPPRANEIEIVGDYAGRQLTIEAGDELLFDGSRPLEPTGISWRLGLQNADFPVTISFRFSDCEAPVHHEIHAAQMPAFLIVRECEVEHVD